jgi:hypothetical protein
MNYLAKAIICFTIFNSGALYAGPAIGTVSENKGSQCEILRGKNKLTGTKGAEVETMDTYSTGACSSNITFRDDTKVKITENSKLIIDDFVYDPKNSDAGKLSIKAAMGTVRYASGQIAKTNPQHVAVQTPTANIAVRGTDFTMTVDETGQSLIVLVPSCKDEKDIKQFELAENRCKVGQIDVITAGGRVTLDKAFEATYVISASVSPTAPVIVNTVESKLTNILIISHPQEIGKAIGVATGKTKKEELEAEIEADAQRRLAQRVRESAEQIEEARLLILSDAALKAGCNPSSSVCVAWDRPTETDLQSRGKAIAFRNTDPDHYAEVKTQGYSSNTLVTIVHNDSSASAVIGSGDPGGTTVYIKQNVGVLRK